MAKGIEGSSRDAEEGKLRPQLRKVAPGLPEGVSELALQGSRSAKTRL